MITVKCGDARELLRSMDPGSVDLIVSDVPYSTIGGGCGPSATHKRPSGMLSTNNSKGGFEHNDIKFSEYFHDLHRVLRDPGHCYIMVNFLNLEDAMRQARLAGFKAHGLLAERKQNCTPNRWYMKNVEFTLFLRKGAAFPINDKGALMCSDWRNPCGHKTHPTEKSVGLMRRYVENSSKPGETVLDPFMGSGATGVACAETDRNFVGYEIDPTYYARACRRLGVMP